MLKARKLGPQSYLDFIREELPTESTTITRKDQNYWINKNQFFSKITFNQQQPNEKYNIEQMKKVKQESELRLKRSEFRRTLLQKKSHQKQFGSQKYAINEEDLSKPLNQRIPIHLENKVDNTWNHLEKLDKKHLKFIYGPKTFKRQEKAIQQIDANLKADIELQVMKQQAKIEFRNKLIKNRSLQSSNEKVQSMNLKVMRKVKPEYQGMLLLNISNTDKYNCPILYNHVIRHDTSHSVQLRSQEKQEYSNKNIRSKSFNTQETEIDEMIFNKQTYNEMNDTIKKFEITLKDKGNYVMY